MSAKRKTTKKKPVAKKTTSKPSKSLPKSAQKMSMTPMLVVIVAVAIVASFFVYRTFARSGEYRVPAAIMESGTCVTAHDAGKSNCIERYGKVAFDAYLERGKKYTICVNARARKGKTQLANFSIFDTGGPRILKRYNIKVNSGWINAGTYNTSATSAYKYTNFNVQPNDLANPTYSNDVGWREVVFTTNSSCSGLNQANSKF